MPVPNIYPSNLQWIGAARETTYGTPVAAPTFWIPADMASIKWVPIVNPLPDTAVRGLMSGEFQQVAGMRHDTLAYKTFPYLDSVYQHFLAAFGKADAVTGSADPWTHKTSVENGAGNASAQPMSFTLFYTDAAGKCWQIPGCMIVDLKLTVKVDDLVAVEPTWMGMPAVAITPPTNTPSTNKPMPSWNSAVTIAGTADVRRSQVDISYKRDTAEVPTINGTQSPLQIFSGTMTASGTFTGVYQGSTDPDLVSYLANTQPALTVKIAPVGDATHGLTLQHSVVAYDTSAPVGSNKWMEIASTIKCLANATDALDGKQSLGQAIFTTSQSAAF
jgi:hypothetical protein